MAYTFGGFKTKVTPSNFGGLVNDGNRNAMTGVLGSFMQSEDAAQSPVGSPVTNMSASGAALTVPPNAAQFVINSSVATQVGEDSTFGNGFTVPANTLWVFDCARMANIYIKPSSGTNTVNFYFNMV